MQAYRVELDGRPGFYSWTKSSPRALKSSTERVYPRSKVEVVGLEGWDMKMVDEANGRILAGVN